MKNLNKKKGIYFGVSMVFVMLISILGTSLYYKKIYVGDNEYLLIDKVYSELSQNYYKKVDKETLLSGAVKGMVNALEDPYSSYMNTEETTEFKLLIENQFVGIGVQIEKGPSGIYITKVFENSPAEKVGITEGDVFSSVDGEDVSEYSVDKLSSLVRGEEGSEVNLKFKRAGFSNELDFTVKRAAIELEDLTYGLVGENDTVGYIKINDFTGDIYEQFSSAYKDLKLKDIKSLIIDVRDNGGGYLDQVIKIVDMFVDDSKPIYQEKKRDKITHKEYGDTKKENIDVAVLINESSASASELLASALNEINGSKLIGTTTFGKGTAQTTQEYTDGSSLKYTFAQWLTPDGNWINETGVAPDVEIELDSSMILNKVLIEKPLKFDQVSKQIENAQKVLVKLGYNTRVDGYFDSETRSAVEKFQKKYGVKNSGEIDMNTANKLNSEYSEILKDYKKDNQIMRAIEVLGND
ncbi:MAG: S41 family peptidase [Bacilli bacterium]